MGGEPLFGLGAVVATPAALEALEKANVAPTELIMRHLSGDWGEVPPEDAKENKFSLEHGFRILSSYPVGDEKVWIITEGDRGATTLLLPDEY